MTDPLSSANIKLRRANLHASTAKRESGRFINKHPAPTIRVEQKHDLEAIPVGTNVVLDILVDRGFPDLPESFSPRFGDAIYNYRCALDHIAWQLVLHGSDPTPKNPKLVQFPIREAEAQFCGDLKTRLCPAPRSRVDR